MAGKRHVNIGGLHSQLADLTRLLILFGALGLVIYCELKSGRVYNWITIPLVLIGLGVNGLFGGLSGSQWSMPGFIDGLMWSFIGGFIGFALYFFFYLVGLMLNYKFLGGGDVKLIAAIGALTGLKFTLWVIYWTILVAAVMGIYMLIRHRVLLKGLVRSVRVFFLIPPDAEGEKPIVEGGVRYSLAIAIGALLTFGHLFIMRSQGFGPGG